MNDNKLNDLQLKGKITQHNSETFHLQAWKRFACRDGQWNFACCVSVVDRIVFAGKSGNAALITSAKSLLISVHHRAAFLINCAVARSIRIMFDARFHVEI